MINARADVNQLLPLKSSWAWDKYLAGCNKVMDLKKEQNFFEARVIEYQSGGGLAWD